MKTPTDGLIMDLRTIKKLIDLVEESAITELEVRKGEESVRIVRPRVPAASSGAGRDSSRAVERAVRTGSRPASAGGYVVKAPLAGTFYRAAAPGEPAFVEPGQKVSVGDVLCIIESMKMMNQIEAERAGTLAEVLVENGAPIAAGQPMFRFE